MTRLAWLAAGCAVVLLGVAVYSARQRPDGPAVVAESAVRYVGRVPVGETRDAVFVLVNHSDEPRTLYGGVPLCGQGGCTMPKYPARTVVIPPGGRVEFACTVAVGAAGPIECPALVSVDDGGLRTIELTVTGTGVVAEGGPDGSHAGR